MRRKEFLVDEKDVQLLQFLEEMSFGFLGTHSVDGYPHITPLNYVYANHCIYFHGSKIGEKMSALHQNKKVTFAVAEELAIIPSYFSQSRFACPATSYFKSAFIKGEALIVEELAEKAEILTLLMKKLQPEGGYDPISLEDEGYVKQISAVALVKIVIKEMTGKFKFGQNLTEPKRELIKDQLLERNLARDNETVKWMEQLCPMHNTKKQT